MSNKTIKINPSFFEKQQKSTTKKKRKQSKSDVSSYNPVNSSKIKKSFIKKIKEFKKHQDNEKRNNTPNSNPNENVKKVEKGAFDESIGFMKSLLKDNREKKDNIEKIKNPSIHVDETKFGSPIIPPKPISNLSHTIDSSSIIQPTFQIPSQIQPAISFNQELIKQPSHQMTTTFKHKKRNKPKNKTIKLGKIKNKNLISILIPDQKRKLEIQEQKQSLKYKDISKIKKYLKKRGLIKSGCIAPKNVLREIYESAILTGDVYNNSKENLIHNFMTLE